LSYINAVASLCEAVGADVRDVILGLGYDKRIGFEYLKPGPGWGGSCLPKDTRALVHIAEQAGYDFSFLKGAIATNDEQFERVVAKVRVALGAPAEASPGDLDGKVIAIWGLAFKAGTDDLRNSPAVEVAQRLARDGATVQAYEPTVRVPAGEVSLVVQGAEAPETEGAGTLRAFGDAISACEGAGVVVVLTEWDQFRWLDFEAVREVMAQPAVVDARNLLDPAQVRRFGFSYVGIGRR
jgi:UDPglucose 6-dehydrogenase